MSVVGKIDAAAFSNTIGVVNGDATVTKNAGDTVVVGDVLEISSVAYMKVEFHLLRCSGEKLGSR